MRIAHCLQALIAVLGLAAVIDQVSSQEHFNDTLHGSRVIRNTHKRHKQFRVDHNLSDSYYKISDSLYKPGEFLSQTDNQLLFKEEMKNRSAADCCPSVLEMIEPTGGKNQEDQYVELYRDGDYRQRFYELSCHPKILHKPCRFMQKKLHPFSKCVQTYSYTYALVKDPGGQRPKNFPTFPSPGGPHGTPWTLDYIRVRSGCACVVVPNVRKRSKQGKRKIPR